MIIDLKKKIKLVPYFDYLNGILVVIKCPYVTTAIETTGCKTVFIFRN